MSIFVYCLCLLPWTCQKICCWQLENRMLRLIKKLDFVPLFTTRTNGNSIFKNKYWSVWYCIKCIRWLAINGFKVLFSVNVSGLLIASEFAFFYIISDIRDSDFSLKHVSTPNGITHVHISAFTYQDKLGINERRTVLILNIIFQWINHTGRNR